MVVACPDDSEMRKRCGSYDAVDGKTVPRLICANRCPRLRPVEAVGGNAQRALNGDDPPSANEPTTAAAEKRCASLRPDNSVHEEAAPGLEGPYRRTRLRPEHAIGRNAERALDRLDVGSSAPELQEPLVGLRSIGAAGARVGAALRRRETGNRGDDERRARRSCLLEKSLLCCRALRVRARARKVPKFWIGKIANRRSGETPIFSRRIEIGDCCRDETAACRRARAPLP